MVKPPSQRSAPASFKIARVAVFVVLAATALLSGCGSRSNPSTQPQTAEQRNAAIVAIAQQFGASEDLEAAQIALAPLSLPNPGQSVLALAEAYIAEGKDTRTTVELVALAKALGPVSRMAGDFLAREGASSGVPAAVAMAPTATPLPTPTDTPVPPTETPTPEPTATPTSTTEPEPTATATATPLAQPQASSASAINVRGGPGTVYPVVGQLQPGQPVDILGRNGDQTWWQVLLSNGNEGWVAASVVDVSGPLDTVAVAANIPAAPTQPPRPTAAPAAQPTAAPAVQPTQAPAQSGGGYVLTSFRLRPNGTDAQSCTGGDHYTLVTVVDAAGNPINGVRIRDEFNGIFVTGSQGKGDGKAEILIWRDGGAGPLGVIDENENWISPITPGMSSCWPQPELMAEAGYCSCKPHPDVESCMADAANHTYLFACYHYVYEVTFQRQ